MKPRSDEEIIAALRTVEVPEPSPLFWDHLSHRVREAIANEPVPTARWTSRFNLAWAPGVLGVVAAAVIAVGIVVHRAVPPNVVPAPQAQELAQTDRLLPALEDDSSWAVMTDLAAELDIDEAAAAGLIATPGSANTLAAELSQEEQQAAVELLRQEMKDSKRL